MNNKLFKIINEEISILNKNKENNLFNYDTIINDIWRDLICDAKKFQKISFDLENNDSTGEKRIFNIHKNLRKNQPIKYQINAELCEAGGDWEIPVFYFKLQFIHDYGIVNSKYYSNPKYVWDIENSSKKLSHSYVIIPPIEAGNKLKKGTKSDKFHYYAYDNNEVNKDEKKLLKITDLDKRSAWKWLADLFQMVVDERHEMLD